MEEKKEGVIGLSHGAARAVEVGGAFLKLLKPQSALDYGLTLRLLLLLALLFLLARLLIVLSHDVSFFSLALRVRFVP